MGIGRALSPDEWRRAKEILEAAIERPAFERLAFVAAKCGADARLRQHVEAMLAHDAPESWPALPGRAQQDAVSPGYPSSVERTHTGPPPAGGSAPAGEPASSSRLAPGFAIGPYTIRSLLGAGGMGEVYLARDTRLDRDVAIKVLAAAVANHPDRRRRFHHEARAAASLNHRNIVAIHDVDLEAALPFIVMEYVPGETLLSLLRRERLPQGRALRISSEIAAALVEAHAHHIAHRDLKPANVMLTPEGSVKVLDFGIAKTVPPLSGLLASAGDEPDGAGTQPGQLVGTPEYMSPEQRLGGRVDRRTDIYSLGVILFELLAGQHPFADLVVPLLTGTPVDAPLPLICRIDPAVPIEVGDLVTRAMAPNPADRPTAAALERSLRTLSMQMSATRPDVASIAVLSFSDMSPGKDQEFFCDGMAEELINALTQIPGLRVAARTSAFQFKGMSRDVRAIGTALNVGAVLDGSVRKAGNRLRVTVDLIGTADGYQLWSDRFDRDLQDVFAVQDEIVRSVIGVLKGKLAVDRPAALVSRRTSVGAYGSYLEGRYHWNKRTGDDLRKSIRCFERAIAQDAGYAPAYAGVADACVMLATYGIEAAATVIPRAREALEAALRIDPALSQAYACRGCVRSIHDWAWSEASHDFRRALTLSSAYPTAHHWYAINHLVPLGRFDEAAEELRLAFELDPLALPIRTSMGMLAYFAGRYDDAVRELTRTIELDERFGLARLFLGATYTEQGRHAEALAELNAAMQWSGSSPEALAAIGYLHGRAGNVDGARSILRELERQSALRYVSPAKVAQVRAGLGEREKALDRLRAAGDERAADLPWLRVRPVFASLHGEPAFEALVQKMGLGNPERPT
ncbi:MAG TPA: protein kinase [Vicinamibacterales bacterium]